MVRFGIQAPHEQINPTALLNDVIMMERYGVKKCWSSDHYMPWWHTGASLYVYTEPSFFTSGKIVDVIRIVNF